MVVLAHRRNDKLAVVRTCLLARQKVGGKADGGPIGGALLSWRQGQWWCSLTSATTSRRWCRCCCLLAGLTKGWRRGGKGSYCWRLVKSGAGLTMGLAGLCNEELAAGQTKAPWHSCLSSLTYWRDYEPVVGLTAVLACWRNNVSTAGWAMVLTRWCDNKSVAVWIVCLVACAMTSWRWGGQRCLGIVSHPILPAQKQVGGGADGNSCSLV